MTESITLNGQTYTFSSSQDEWFGPDGKRAGQQIARALNAKVSDARRAASITRLDEVDELFNQMYGPSERAAAIRWLITTYGLGGLV